MAPSPSRSRPNATRPLSILRLILAIGEESAPYNQFSLALTSQHNITICTYFKSSISLPKEITLFEGNDSLKGFFRALKAALDRTEYDIIHAHSPHLGFLYLVANFMHREFTTPTVYTTHDSYRNYRLRNKLLLIPVFAFFNRVVCCGYASRNSFTAPYKWLAGDRLRAIQNGVDIERIEGLINENQPSLGVGIFNVVTIGRLEKVKNHRSVLKAFQQFSDGKSRLQIIGEGRLHTSIASEVAASDMGEVVELTGLIPRERVYKRLLEADLFVTASRGEGLPVAVLEAMACHLPVVLSDIPPHREIAEGVDFIPLIECDDVNGFALEIERFRRMPAPARAEIGAKCRRHVEKRFHLAKMHNGYSEIYRELVAQFNGVCTIVPSGDDQEPGASRTNRGRKS